MIVGDQINRAVKRYPDAVAVICDDERCTFRELDERTTRLANALLGMGLARGERVCCLLRNSIRCVEVDFALSKAGLVRVSVNPRCTAKELRYILTDSGARASIADAGFDGLMGEIEDVAPELRIRVGEGIAPALDYDELIEVASVEPLQERFDGEALYCLFYTSGTTGRPKGVMLSHRAICTLPSTSSWTWAPRSPARRSSSCNP